VRSARRQAVLRALRPGREAATFPPGLESVDGLPGLASPELEAAIFRALEEVPGVTVTELDVSRRPALAVAQTEDWLQEELLLDKRT
jgi:hypothetical protein